MYYNYTVKRSVLVCSIEDARSKICTNPINSNVMKGGIRKSPRQGLARKVSFERMLKFAIEDYYSGISTERPVAILIYPRSLSYKDTKRDCKVDVVSQSDESFS